MQTGRWIPTFQGNLQRISSGATHKGGSLSGTALPIGKLHEATSLEVYRYHVRNVLYLRNFMEQKLLEKIIVSWVVKTLPVFFGTRSFITVYTRASLLVPILRKMKLFFILSSYFLKIRCNIFPRIYNVASVLKFIKLCVCGLISWQVVVCQILR